ncbi:hypothetical protein BCR36DRAFT_356114, partial [Piromyces finnis]
MNYNQQQQQQQQNDRSCTEFKVIFEYIISLKKSYFEALVFNKNFENDIIIKKFNDEIFLNEVVFNKYNNNEYNVLRDYIYFYLSKSKKPIANEYMFKLYLRLYNLLFRSLNNYTKKNVAKFVLFIVSFKDYLMGLTEYIDYFNSLSKFDVKTINLIYIGKSEISREIQIIYNLYECTFNHILNLEEWFNNNDVSIQSIDLFTEKLKELRDLSMKTSFKLKLEFKQLFYIQDFIYVKEAFNDTIVSLKSYLSYYLGILKKENEHFNLHYYYLLGNANDHLIEEEFNFLKEKLPSYIYETLVVKLINNKINECKDDKYQSQLLKTVCSQEGNIFKFKNFFKSLFNKYTIFKYKNKNNNNNNDVPNDLNGFNFLELQNDRNINSIFKYLNQTTNYLVDEVLISVFNDYVINYFDSQYDDEDKILKQSFLLFKKFVTYIEVNKCEITGKNKINILFTISYIKCYCFHLCNILHKEGATNLNLSQVFEFLDKTNLNKIVKIYILRVLNKIIIKDYSDLLKFINKKQLFINDFDFSEKSNFGLNHLFLQEGSFELYKKFSELYNINKVAEFQNKNDHELNEMLNKDTLLVFYDLIINKEISSFIQSEKFNESYYKKLCCYLTETLCKLNLPTPSENILKIYYDYDSLSSEYNTIKNLSNTEFEVLMYANKFALISSLSKPNTFYSDIISDNVVENLKNLYIPGGEIYHTLLVDSAKEIQEYFNNNSTRLFGAYVCDCGKSYYLENCTQPGGIFICTNCKQYISGNNHILIPREGHMRIYSNQEERNRFPHIPGILIDNLLNDINQKINEETPGFRRLHKNCFHNFHKKIRNISNVTYRILSFIFFSCLYIDGKLKYIGENGLKEFSYLDSNQSMLSILNDIWHTLNIELGRRGVENKVPCFLNMIIPKIAHLILSNDMKMVTAEERNQFEKECNEIIESALIESNFNNFYQQSIKDRNDILNYDDFTIKCILEETSDIERLPNNEFPLIRYFYAVNYSTYDEFYKLFNDIPDEVYKYPVLTTYFKYSHKMPDKIKILESFQFINPFVVYVLEKYSNKLARIEAKQISIKSELEKDEKMKNLFVNFKKGWNNIFEILTNFDCHGELTPKNIDENDCLAYVLNDTVEDGYGKYIATYYNDIISIHNEILKSLIPENNLKYYLKPFQNQLENYNTVQDTTYNEIISFNINNDLYGSI